DVYSGAVGGVVVLFFFSSRRRHTRFSRDWSSDVCSSDLRTENAAQDLFLAGLVKGTTHLAAGQEAVAVGASAALREDDYVFATYRGHHHAIARGATPEECLAELMQKATGVCKAKGGSMHLTRADKHMLGSYAIVGAR